MSSSPVSPSSLANAFSPVKVADSPCHTQRGNLTGTPRKVKDSVAEIYNLIQKWNNLHADGAKLLRRISDELPNNSTDSQQDDKERDRANRLQRRCLLMMEVKDKLVEVVENLKIIHSHFVSLEKLERLNRNYDPIFLTWPLSHYVELSKVVHESYKSQLAMNVYVVENLALGTQKSADALIALWIHQPYVDQIVNFKVDAALKETGFV